MERPNCQVSWWQQWVSRGKPWVRLWREGERCNILPGDVQTRSWPLKFNTQHDKQPVLLKAACLLSGTEPPGCKVGITERKKKKKTHHRWERQNGLLELYFDSSGKTFNAGKNFVNRSLHWIIYVCFPSTRGGSAAKNNQLIVVYANST